MGISNNTLAAYFAGVSSKEEDKLVLNELAGNECFSDLLDLIEEFDSVDNIDALRNEFNENTDQFDSLKDFNEKIK